MVSEDEFEVLAIPAAIIDAIETVRGERVILDMDLARLYGVDTRTFNQAVRRHPARFPADFMFQLTAEEWGSLRSHFATSNVGRGGRRYLPYVFTEQGVAMLSSVLNSERAIAVNVEVMRAFVRMRRFMASHEELAGKLREIEDKFESKLTRHDQQLMQLFEALRRLRDSVEKRPAAPSPKRRIGFHTDEADGNKPKAKRRKA